LCASGDDANAHWRRAAADGRLADVARAPAILTVRVSVQSAAENRMLQVVAESPDFYRSSEIQIDGANTPPLNVFEFRNLPTGTYRVTGVLVGVNGRRAMISQLARVEPTFGR